MVARHPRASVFHTPAWLHSLQRTYGYRPVVFTTAPPESVLEEGVVFCEVRSWLTGRRLVSLPFSDHCEPLLMRDETAQTIFAHLEGIQREGQWKYIELRPRGDRFSFARGPAAAERFWFHAIDLARSEETLFAAFHRNSIQQPIGRAGREGLRDAEGSSDELVQTFYRLLLLTRRRHQLPPQPLEWFRNLADAFGPSMKVRVATHANEAVAAIVTLRHGNVMFYKYAASDAKFHSLGGTQFLLWNAIREARATGCTTFDLGRSDLDNEGLAVFKDRWGATRSELTYWCYGKAASSGALRKLAIRSAKGVLERAPRVCRVAAGRFLYRHAG